MNKVIIGLGSNIDPEENIEKAREILRNQFHILNESKFIRTKPVGYPNQADFINGCVFIETDIDSEKLRQSLKQMEVELGRKRADFKCGPRTIDLDIVVFNEKVIDEDFYKRDFLKNATLELLPELKY